MYITVETMDINANVLVPVPITKKIPLKDKNSAHLHMSLLNAHSQSGTKMVQ